ncbi:hypothetical protein [Streptomyces canus]|uniref:hypothetical protein n=1 Tax=Streptomyces canus TaxID=58343 RepID=UPI00381C0EF3
MTGPDPVLAAPSSPDSTDASVRLGGAGTRPPWASVHIPISAPARRPDSTSALSVRTDPSGAVQRTGANDR